MKKRFFEIIYIILTMSTVFTGLSLFSYNVNDPSYSNIVFNRYKETVDNLFGKAGAYTADMLGTVFGWSSFLLPFFIIFLLILTIKLYKEKITPLRLLGAVISGLTFILMLSILSGLVGGKDLVFTYKISGGIFGAAGAVVIASVFGKVGGIILTSTSLFLALLGTINLSMSEFVNNVINRFSNNSDFEQENEESMLSNLLRRFALWREKRKDENTFKSRLKEAEREQKRAAEEERILQERESVINKQVEKDSDIQHVNMPIRDLEQQYAEIPENNEPEYTVEAVHEYDEKEYMTVGELEKLLKEEDESDNNINEFINNIDRDQVQNESVEEYTVTNEYHIKKEYHVTHENESEVLINTPEDDQQQEEPAIIAKPIEKHTYSGYHIPYELLDPVAENLEAPDPDVLQSKAELLIQKLSDFGVSANVAGIHPGPVVTMFELELAPGIKLNKIASLENDLALAMSALSIRILAPIPGKAAVGVEIPNPKRAMISIRELLESEQFEKTTSPLTVALGKDIGGNLFYSDLASMPHLLVAGTTGSGKSVCINTLLCSILYKSSPDMVKLIMIDPKMVELSVYEGIPHLAAPVVTDPRKAAAVLNNVVKEMENRYALLASCRVKSITTYNAFMENNPNHMDPDGNPLKFMPYMVVIVDEFADLMMVAGKDVEASIARIAQMARAVGIHLVLATQRPSVNVITGLIKANMPARISFRVSSKIDSRTILDQNGAEGLLGKGDSLFIPPGRSDMLRIHGCFLSEEEVIRVVDHLKTFGEPDYDMTLLEEKVPESDGYDDEEYDDRFDEALQIVKDKGSASISMIQRHLRIGYNRAARIVEMMERQGLIAPSDGTSKPREYLGD